MEPQTLSDVGVLIKAIICGMVDHPQAVEVQEIRGTYSIVLEVRVAPEDQGKVIGRQGRTAQAIRDLLVNFGGRSRRRYLLNLLGNGDLCRLIPDSSHSDPVSTAFVPATLRSRPVERVEAVKAAS